MCPEACPAFTHHSPHRTNDLGREPGKTPILITGNPNLSDDLRVSTESPSGVLGGGIGDDRKTEAGGGSGPGPGPGPQPVGDVRWTGVPKTDAAAAAAVRPKEASCPPLRGIHPFVGLGAYGTYTHMHLVCRHLPTHRPLVRGFRTNRRIGRRMRGVLQGPCSTHSSIGAMGTPAAGPPPHEGRDPGGALRHSVIYIICLHVGPRWVCSPQTWVNG